MRPDPLETAGRHVPGRGATHVSRLRSGEVNDTYRVVRDGHAYALRLSTGPAAGIDRLWECRVLGHAARAGLAPPVHYCDPAAGILVSAWVDGRTWTERDAQGAGVTRMAGLMRRIHALRPPQPACTVTPAGWIERYAALLQNAAAVPRHLRPAAEARLTALAQLPAVHPVLCHGDLHPHNLVESDRALVVLDWEYCHLTDPYWDLAAWSSANDWGAAARLELLRAYAAGDPTPQDCRRFDLLAWLYDYVCLLWSGLLPGAAVRPDGAGAAAAVVQRARLLAARLDAYPVVAAADLRHTTRPGEPR